MIQYNNFINNTKQADLQKIVLLLQSLNLPFFRQQWENNYWNDWIKTNPRPITGLGIIFIFVPDGVKEVPIVFFIVLEFDWHPAQKPNNIPISEEKT